MFRILLPYLLMGGSLLILYKVVFHIGAAIEEVERKAGKERVYYDNDPAPRAAVIEALRSGISINEAMRDEHRNFFDRTDVRVALHKGSEFTMSTFAWFVAGAFLMLGAAFGLMMFMYYLLRGF